MNTKLPAFKAIIKEELYNRKLVYPVQIAKGKISKEKANKQFSLLTDAQRILEGELPRHGTREEVEKELHREYDLRKRLYPRWVSEGKLNKHQAQKKIRAWGEMMDYICPLKIEPDGSEQQGQLF